MREIIKSEIAKRLEELQALEARTSVVRIEIDVLTDVLNRVPEGAEPTGQNHDTPERSATDTGHERRDAAPSMIETNGHGNGDRKPNITTGHRLSRKWAVVRDEAVRRYPGFIRNAEVPAIQRRCGFEPASGANVRSHLHGGVQAGLYERVDHAAYRATQKAADAAGFPLGSGGARTEPETLFQKEEEPGGDEPPGPSPLLMGAA